MFSKCENNIFYSIYILTNNYMIIIYIYYLSKKYRDISENLFLNRIQKINSLSYIYKLLNNKKIIVSCYIYI